MKKLMRLLYFVMGGLVVLLTLGADMMKHLNAVRIAHIEGSLQSYVLGCVSAKEGAEGSYDDCVFQARLHQKDIMDIVGETE
jgi:hypothetical protein